MEEGGGERRVYYIGVRGIMVRAIDFVRNFWYEVATRLLQVYSKHTQTSSKYLSEINIISGLRCSSKQYLYV